MSSVDIHKISFFIDSEVMLLRIASYLTLTKPKKILSNTYGWLLWVTNSEDVLVSADSYKYRDVYVRNDLLYDMNTSFHSTRFRLQSCSLLPSQPFMWRTNMYTSRAITQ